MLSVPVPRTEMVFPFRLTTGHALAKDAGVPWLTVTAGSDVSVKLGTLETTLTVGVPEIVAVNVGKLVNVKLGTDDTTLTVQGAPP